MTPPLGRIGVWSPPTFLSPQIARELEQLGYGTIWIGSSPSGDLGLAEELLDATSSITIATGIVNIWKDDPQLTASSYHRVTAKHPNRFLLGIGIGHPEHTGSAYTRPYEALVGYLDGLDEGRVPVSERVLAALGPKVLRLARDRSAGAHPYLTTPEHTREAREILGAGPILAPEQKVVLDPDPERARALARPRVRNPYLGLSNYRNNLARLGFTEADMSGDGSDRLIDALVAHGDAAVIGKRLRAHLDAGADHVCIQLLSAPDADRTAQYAAIAAAFGS